LELAGVEQSITNAQNARGRIIALAARGIITDDEAETELRSLLSEIGALSARREFLFSRMESASRTEREAIDAQSALEILGREIDSGISEDKKAQLFKILVRRVEMFTVEKDGKRDSKASIHYRFPVSNDHCVGLSKLGDVKM
ncbi:MAG: hypothetical protein PHU78_08875, partial [Heliobacteriaceae bacterium]|nr:hypothetical protein [Heliobacteriaceae bacterium]